MKRCKKALVVDLDTAAEMLLSTVTYLKREIREGSLRAIKLGSKTVVRTDELREYLLRKEAEEPTARKTRKAKNASTNDNTGAGDDRAPEDASVPPEAESVHDEDVPELKDGDDGLDEIWGDDSVQNRQE